MPPERRRRDLRRERGGKRDNRWAFRDNPVDAGVPESRLNK
jgi:hypothetical protein